MPQTLVINAQQQSTLEQIFNELKYALKKTLSEDDLWQLSWEIVKTSGGQTVQSKKNAFVSLGKGIGKISGKVYRATKDKIHRYQERGLNGEFENDLQWIKKTANEAPGKTKAWGEKMWGKATDFNQNFLQKSKDEKIEMIAVGVMAIFIFFISAGGEDLEGGIPDTDLQLGIGFHRHILSHSIFAGFVVEFLMRSGIELINHSHKNLPEEHHDFWDKAQFYMNKHKGVAVGAMWAGVSAHLVQDSGVLGHGVKPYEGIPFEMPMEAHEGLFAANGVAAAMFAFKDSTTKE